MALPFLVSVGGTETKDAFLLPGILTGTKDGYFSPGFVVSVA